MRPSPADRGVIKVDPGFDEEFPDGDVRSTAVFATLARTGTAVLIEVERCLRETLDIPMIASTTLAVIEGAEGPLTPSEISDRMLLPSATMTATLDLLERRGWIERRPNPGDRRSTLVSITEPGRATTDRMLPGLRTLERETMSGLTPRELDTMLRLLGKVLDRAAEIAAEPPIPLEGRRNRPPRSSA